MIKLWAELVSPEVSLLGFSPATDGHLLPVSLHMFFPVCTSLCPTLLFSYGHQICQIKITPTASV